MAPLTRREREEREGLIDPPHARSRSLPALAREKSENLTASHARSRMRNVSTIGHAGLWIPRMGRGFNSLATKGAATGIGLTGSSYARAGLNFFSRLNSRLNSRLREG